ncbi:tetraacyldisaccharide 4'-kinase [bacterium (candidate division B38) B3_B38]|nr:MAG: tetraacyldisaccharide 4'-kinase [bacterium (candidate division B38) B3_B38]
MNDIGSIREDRGTITGKTSSPLILLMLPLIKLYQWFLEWRNWMWDRGLFTLRRLSGKVISIGNLTVGGTGKTPLTLYVARFLHQKGFRVAVLSRGYKREKKRALAVVSDGEKILSSPRYAGDEPYLIARNLPAVAVVVHPDRYRAGQWAEEKLGAEMYLLDDGFQHRRLWRDVDILLLDGNEIQPELHLFPRGRLREPLKGIRRADIIVITQSAPGQSHSPVLEAIKRYNPTAPLFYSQRLLKGLFWVKGDRKVREPPFRTRRVVSLCAIAQPLYFEEDLRQLQLEIVRSFRFRDHHWYNQKEVNAVVSTARQLNTEAVVTTEKDALRLSQLKLGDLPFLYLKIDIEIREQEEFQQTLMSKLRLNPEGE